MENAADALKMAGSILMFVIALSVAITSFSQARATSDIVLSYTDRESTYINGNDNYYYIGNNENTKRIVGAETIIPTIYRAFSGGYKIVFDFGNNENYYIYIDSKGNKVNKIDFQNLNIADSKAEEEFLNAIIYGASNPSNICKKFDIQSLNNTSLYQKISDKKFEENLGVYYMEDINSNDDNIHEEENRNKTIKRVITYKIR